jgi:uncharacterized membrane protein
LKTDTSGQYLLFAAREYRHPMPEAPHVSVRSMQPRATPNRLNAFSDGVFAVVITILVLELGPPATPTYAALLALWPRWLSYGVTYIFIAIVWTNHHYLMRYARKATPRLVWFNLAHLFSMSLSPLATAWMATSELAPQPVSFYAAVFFLVNATYVALVWELIDMNPATAVSTVMRRIMRWRSVITTALFGAATVVALDHPYAGLSICVCCVGAYLRPEPRFPFELARERSAC